MKKNNIFEQIKQSSNIVSEVSLYLNLNKKGKNYWGICPFHEDTSPSMSVSPDKQLFKCFVCQVGGNVINFISEFEKITFIDAAKKLALKNGVEVNFKNSKQKEYSEKDKKLLSVIKEAMNFFQYSLSVQENNEALNYLAERGIKQKEIDKFSIGYAPKHGLVDFLRKKGHDESDIINASLATERMTDFFRDRIIFGIKNNHGQLVGFSARAINPTDKTKYINSSETKLFNKSQILYNFSEAEQSIRRKKEVFIVEGFMDVIALDKSNISNSVAIMGTALTKQHAKFLLHKKIVLMLDSDNAGIEATIKSIKSILDFNQNIYVVQNQTGLDPDEIMKQKGASELQNITQNRIHALDFIFEMHKKKFGIEKGVKSIELMKSFVRYLGNLEKSFKDIYISKLHDLTGVSIETITESIQPKKELIEKDIELPSDPIINDAEKKVGKSQQVKNKWIIKLFSAMTNHHNFIYIFKEHLPNFSDSMNIVLGKYLISLKTGENNNNIVNKEKLKEILIGYSGYDSGIVTEKQFKEVLDNIDEESAKRVTEERMKRINDAKTTEEDKINILNDLIKSQKGDK